MQSIQSTEVAGNEVLGVAMLDGSGAARDDRRRGAAGSVQDPAQRRGGAVRAVEDHRRHDQGLRGQWRTGRRVGADPRGGGLLTEGRGPALLRRQPAGGTFHIEDVQDRVELSLMRSGEHEVARAYVLYRQRRAEERCACRRAAPEQASPFQITDDNGRRVPLDIARLKRCCLRPAKGPRFDTGLILESALKNLYDGVPAAEVRKALILSSRTPDRVRIRRTALRHRAPAAQRHPFRSPQTRTFPEEMEEGLRGLFPEFHPFRDRHRDLLDPRPGRIRPQSSGRLAGRPARHAVRISRPADAVRPLLPHREERRIELPQAFFMRVAMGLALNEVEQERAIEFYEVLSQVRFRQSSTPTLFNSGTLRCSCRRAT